MSLLNDNDNKLNVLFKSLQGKTQARPDVDGTASSNVPFFSETVKGLKNVFQEDIFSETFPSSLPASQTVASLFNNPTIPKSSWNTNVYDQSLSFVDLVDNSGNPIPLRFYKSVYLKQPVSGTPQSWWLLDSSSADAIPENNVLRSMIPFGYDGIANSTFQPVVEYNNSSTWVPDNTQGSAILGWLVDYPTGVLQLYQNDSTLNTYNINNPADNVEIGRPRISFIKYQGNYGSGGGGGSGTVGKINVGELSGNAPQPTQDVSAIYFDKEDFDISFVSNTARISFIGSGNANVSDLSYYFFDVPNDLSGTGDLSFSSVEPTPFIELFIDPPSQTKSALPFGKALQYKNVSGAQTEENIQVLPFFRELKIQAKDWNDGLNHLSGWKDLSINTLSPSQTIIPPTIRYMKLSYAGTDISLLNQTNQTTNPPFTQYRNFVDLTVGGNYQFRLYLTNDGDEPGITDLYGDDVSYNYLYIPNISGDGILLGELGYPTAPTDISFLIQDLTNFTLRGVNNDPSGSDTSGNIPFPINPLLNYQVFFGVDISQTPLVAFTAAKQMPNIRSNIPDASYQYETPSQLVNTWTATNTTLTISTVYPETNYRATFHYMRNSVADNSNVLAYQTPSADVSYTTGIPTRGAQTGAETLRMSSSTLSFSPAAAGLTTTQTIPITSGSTPIYDVYFLSDASTADFNVGNLPGSFANNKVTASPDSLFAGIDSSGTDLTFLQFSSSGGAISYDASTNKTKGYLDISNINIQNGDTQFFDLSASSSEGGDLLPQYTKRGYYTDVVINGAILTDVSLGSYPDICNNSYNHYDVNIRDHYNDGSGNFTPGNIAAGKLYIGRKPPNNISYGENTYTNPTVSLVHNFFGLKMPDPRTSGTNASVTYTYDLSQIALWWKPNTTTIANATLEYEPAGSSYDVDNETRNWPSNTEVPQITVNPSLELKTDTWAQNTSHTRKYSRDVADTTFTGRQFQIKTEYNGNVTYWGGADYDTTATRDLSFGIPGKYLWWDTTWSTSSTSATPSNLPSNYFSTTGTYVGDPSFAFIPAVGQNGWSSATTYNHTLDTSNNQLMWANAGFRGNSTNDSNDPYINFSGNFYNPGNVLKDYSTIKNTGASLSINYDGVGVNKVWWSGTGSSGFVSRTIKYITFNINVPYTDDITGTGSNIAFTLSGSGFSKDSNPNGSANGCWVFHNENANGVFDGPFDGQGQAGVGNFSGGSIASYESGPPSGYAINTPSSNNSGVPGSYKTVLQISIGIPNNLNTNLASIAVGFTKY